jgi:hypothetical protein
MEEDKNFYKGLIKMNLIIKQSTIERLRLFIMIVILLCYGFYSINQNQILPLIALGLLFLLLVQGTTIEDFYVIVALLPFAGLVTISNKGVLFIPLGIAILKLILSFKLKKAMIISSIVILVFEILNDVFSVTIGHSLDILAIILYFSCFIMFANLERYNHQKTLKYFCISVGIAMFFVLIASGGSFNSFVQSNNGYIVRFGDENRNLV